MMKYLVKFANLLKRFMVSNKNYLRLNSIIKKDNEIYCEFNEILRLDGNLHKLNIEEIARNKNIQDSIAPETLFIIGTMYGKYQDSVNEFRVKTIDILNKSITLENNQEKITIEIVDLLQDKNLIQSINRLDLVKIIQPYAYKMGYNFHSTLTEKSSIPQKLDKAENNNIVNLF